MRKGNIVLITFPFTDLSGNKLRPAVVLCESSTDYTVCFITSQITFSLETDVHLSPNNVNRLRAKSLIRTSKIATLDKRLAKGLLGELSHIELTELNIQLKKLLQLD
jgi:mRNA interferase MazF